jgi:hypothetical protein|tara:strand:+ start:71 stop:232 length:162 start_codon:yes stop_codon:yes gene_type:complete
LNIKKSSLSHEALEWILTCIRSLMKTSHDAALHSQHMERDGEQRASPGMDAFS